MPNQNKPYRFTFEKLDVWWNAIALGKLVYKITNDFPREERYSFTDQVRRSAVSVSSNIAEGSGKSSTKEQSRFLNMAYSSLMELMSQLMLAKELNYINDEHLMEVREKIIHIANQLNNLNKYYQNRTKTK